MAAIIGRSFNFVRALLDGGGGDLPFIDQDLIAHCESQLADYAKLEDLKKTFNIQVKTSNESEVMRLSTALVHSRCLEDVKRGMSMAEDALAVQNSTLSKGQLTYALAVGYYRTGDLSKSKRLVEQCVETCGNRDKALRLKKLIEHHMAIGSVSSMAIPTAAVVGVAAGVVVSGIVGSLARKK